MALLAGLLGAPATTSAQRLVVLPPENLSEASGAPGWIQPLIQEAVVERGWEPVAGSAVESWLGTARVRRLDSLPAEIRESLLDDFGAGAYLATTIFSVRLEAVPVVTIGIRLVDVIGTERFSEVVGLSTEDTVSPLEDRPSSDIRPLLSRVVDELFRRFPEPAGAARQPPPGEGPAKLHKPYTFLSSRLDEFLPPRRVAVLPFRNFSDDGEAARIAAQLTARWLGRAPGFELVEPADLRRALAEEGVRDAGTLRPEVRAAVGRRLATPLFLQGTIYRWNPESAGGSEVSPPEVELNLTLVDAASMRIVWSVQHIRRGDQYRGLLGLGGVSNVVALADRTIGEVFAAQAAARPSTVPPPRPPFTPPIGIVKNGAEQP